MEKCDYMRYVRKTAGESITAECLVGTACHPNISLDVFSLVTAREALL